MNKLANPHELAFDPQAWVPPDVGDLSDHQTALPRIARDPKIIADIESRLSQIPTRHDLYRHDSRQIKFLAPNSVHLVLTSPPYWTLKDYREHPDQMGYIADYEKFLTDLDKVWRACFDALVPGGRLVCVVGDVCLSRRKNKGEHTVVPLHASIQEHCRAIGFSNIAPIIWHKIANAVYEANGNGGGFLGKPYEPNSVIKNDIEFILMERKPGGYRSPSVATRILSVIPAERHKVWFQQIWTGVTGASTKQHPAPYPMELAERLVRMLCLLAIRCSIHSWERRLLILPPRSGAEIALGLKSIHTILRWHFADSNTTRLNFFHRGQSRPTKVIRGNWVFVKKQNRRTIVRK